MRLFAKKHPDILQYCFSVAQFIAYLGYIKPDCPRWNASNLAANFTLHVVVDCGVVHRARMKFNRFVLKHIGVNVLTALNRVEYVNSLLGMHVSQLFILLGERYDAFVKLSYRFLYHVWSIYNS